MNTNRWIWNNSNIHNNTSAGTVLHTMKGEKDGRPAVEQLVAIRRRSLTSDDSRTGVQRTDNCSIDDTTPPAIAVVFGLHLKKVSTIGPLHQRCRAVALLPTLTTTSEVPQTWLSAAGTITFKLFDSPLHESSAANFIIFAPVGRRQLQYRSVQSFTKSQMTSNYLSTSTL